MRNTIIPVTHYQQNCSLVVCEETGKAALIDPGGDADVLGEEIARQDVELQWVLLTHGHLDHIGAAVELKNRFTVPIIGPHPADLFWLQSMEQQSEYMGFAPAQNFVPDQWLNDGDQLHLGQLLFEVLHCPGHTPGHVVFVEKQSQVAWVGDVIFRGSVGRSDFPGGDHETLIARIQNKLWPLGQQFTFIPGHGPTSTLGWEMKHNPFLQG